MSNPSNRRITISLRLYRALAAAFPYEFKNAYGDEMVQVTEDAIEDIWRRFGVFGLVRLLADIAIRIPIEYLAELRQDVRYGLRMLAGSPGFTTVALLSLTLGIGVATSAFSEMNGFIMRDVPGVANPGQLVLLQSPASYPDYRRYREQSGLFSSTLAYRAPVPFGVSTGGPTERTWGHVVTPSYFSTLGVQPAFGRVFDQREEQPGGPPVVVVSYRLWQTSLSSDPGVIGKAIRINGQPCTVIGVGPPGFQGASPMVYLADLWLPVSAPASVVPEMGDNALERHDLRTFHVIGRLLPGVTPPRAEAAWEAVARQLEQEYNDPNRNQEGRRIGLLPGGKLMPVRKQDLPFLTGFFTVLGGMILLIASSNVANMMLARAADRRKEIAVRLALGAGRTRLIRQLLTESMLLAVAAGMLGFLMAVILMHFASQMKLPLPMPLTLNLTPDAGVLMFSLGLTAFTGFAFGLIPALQATRPDLTVALKEGGNVRLRRFRRLSLRNLLVLTQVSASLALLLITGFLVMGHRRIAGANLGFDARNLSLISVDPVRDGYSSARATDFFAKLLDRVKALPLVSDATFAESVPMTMIGKPPATFTVRETGAGEAKTLHSARRYVVGKDFFDTIGIPIVRGRTFRKEDESNDSTAVIVSEKLARECWKGEDPLGRRIETGNDELPGFTVAGSVWSRPAMSGRPRVLEVVGVVRNVRDGLVIVAADAPAVVYLPLRPSDYARPSLLGVTLIVRAAPGMDAIGAVRREMSAMDTNLKPFNARIMSDQIETIMFVVRSALWTYGAIGIFGLILAAVGLAGVTAYSVTQRSREIGIRMALGARGSDVLALVMKEGAVLVAIGTVFGLCAARAGIRLMSAALGQIAKTAGTSTDDPLLLVACPALLAALALVACYVPARKSMRIDPVVALRQE